MTLFLIFDMLGTAAFAISVAAFAMQKKMDPFGVLIIGFVTAIGGCTLRDSDRKRTGNLDDPIALC